MGNTPLWGTIRTSPSCCKRLNACLTGARPGDEVEAEVEAAAGEPGTDPRKTVYRFRVREVKERSCPR